MCVGVVWVGVGGWEGGRVTVAATVLGCPGSFEIFTISDVVPCTAEQP